MSIRNRLLGLAFASSDLLLELDGKGKVVLGLGSGPATGLSAESFCGAALWNRVAPTCVEQLNGVLSSLQPGARSAPVELVFNAGEGRLRRAAARFFQLPDLAPNISCSVTWEGPNYAVHDPEAPPVLAPADFLARAGQVLAPSSTPRDLAVAFVEVEGLAGQSEGEAGQRLNARVEAALQAASVDGSSAGRLGPETFAVLRDRSVEADIAGELRELGQSEGVDLAVRSLETALGSEGQSLNALRALRFAVEGCLKDGPDGTPPETTFKAALSRTLTEAHAFRAIVQNRRFDLHYQPIVDLRTEAVHHFEALARFKGSDSPAQTIHMAEEMGLIEGFDLAVVEKALVRLRQPGAGLMKFAVNVSGASLADDRYIQTLLRMTSARPEERHRLIVEVTESAALADVDAANRRLGALRAAGVRVCIDDFGAGSASYDYLRRLSVDTVKIDGAFVEDLDTDPRARTLIGHLVELCRSMKVETIAEKIETQAVADIVRDLGVDLGQGWLFGKAEAEPRTVLATVAPAARRMGAVAGWG